MKSGRSTPSSSRRVRTSRLPARCTFDSVTLRARSGWQTCASWTSKPEATYSPGSIAAAQSFESVWNQWPLGEQNTVGQVAVINGTLQVTLNNPPGGIWPDFHLHSQPNLSFSAHRKYRVTFRAQATPKREIHPVVYQILNGVYTDFGGPPGHILEQLALARDAGVNLVTFGAPNGWSPSEQPRDLQALDELCRQTVAVNPKVLLIPRVDAKAPDWWLRCHPEPCMVYDTNQPGHFAPISQPHLSR